MPKAHIHAEDSKRRHGGTTSDYLDFHIFMDSSKSAMASYQHRFLTHNTWFISVVIPRIFGDTIINSDGKLVSTKDLGEEHVLMDYGQKFIPTAQDYLQEIDIQPWMENGKSSQYPPSCKAIEKLRKNKIKSIQAKVD